MIKSIDNLLKRVYNININKKRGIPMEAQNEKTLEQAQLLEDMSKDYWELVNQESSQMFVNSQRLSGLTIRAIALQAGARALRAEVTRED